MNPSKSISHIFSTYWFRIGSIVLVGVLIRFIIAISYALMEREHERMELSEFPNAWTDYLVFWAAAAVVLELLRWLHRRIDRHLLWAVNPMRRFCWQLGLDLACTCVLTSLLTIAISREIYGASPYLTGEWGFIGRQLFFVNIPILILVTAMAGIELGVFLVQQWQQSLVDVERFKKDSIEARFHTLKGQVNPHFLFNTLNTLSSLIHIDQEAAATFVRQLAKVYRAVLDHHEKEVIDVTTELAIFEAYRYLVETRFREKLRLTLDIPERLHSCGIPPLTLQMLLENALKHNVISQQRPLTVRIFTENDAYLVVENALQPKIGDDDSPKIGLTNLISRYAYVTNRPVIIAPTDTTFTVKIPLLPTAELPERLTAQLMESKD